MKNVQIYLLLICSLLIYSCSQKKKLSNPSSFKEIISLYSNHHLSVKSPIVIRFVEDVVKKNKVVAHPSIFTITPHADGKLVWKQKNTLEFKPDSPLKSGQSYHVSVKLSNLFSGISDSLKTFSFEVTTKHQNFEFGGSYLTPINDSLFKLNGRINTTDYIKEDDLKKIVKAKIGDETKNISFFRYGDNYSFKIDSIKRKYDDQTLQLSLNGKSIGYSINRNSTITIPALGGFKLVNSEITQNKTQQIKLLFSEFIDQSQSIEGLINVSKGKHEITIQDNYALINFKEHIKGQVAITIEKGLLSKQNFPLQRKEKTTVNFEPILPGVRLISRNTILPYGNSLPFAFETVNIKAIDIKITKVYQKNMFQFLQKNDLNGSHNINYVGETILTKKINLDTNKNLSLWNKQVINLKSLIAEDPTALYNIEVGFRKSYTTYPCKEENDKQHDPSTIGNTDNVKVTEQNFWTQHKTNYGSYDWDEIKNPCHNMFYEKDYDYYGENKSLSTNILGSNLGVIAKKEKNGNLLFAITSIKTTQPIFGAKVEVINYSNRILKTGFTNAQGIVRLNNAKSPFLVIVSHGNQRGYLKLNDSESLSLSSFDADGNSTTQDLKGFLYAERGVWRPGDSIYINFILEDKFNNLPKGYPIGFEFTNPNGQIVERRTTTKGINGHYKFWTKTNISDITGDYLVKAYAGKNNYTKYIKVETIRPNRLKIDVAIGSNDKLYADSLVNTKITTKWLHGAKGVNLRHKIDATFTQGYTYFKKYGNYNFEAPYRNFNATEYTFLDKKTNAEGVIEQSQKITTIKNAPGFVNAHFKIKVFEKGGRFSIDKTSKTFYPYASYVGINTPNNYSTYNINKAAKFNLVNLTSTGKTKNDKLIITLYKLEYNWWYDIKNNDKYVYKGQMNKKAVLTDTLTTKNGHANYSLLLKEHLTQGRYLLLAKNTEGHKTGKVISFHNRESYGYPQHVSEATTTSIKGTKKLSLSADKKVYKTNDLVKISIPTAGAGKILLTLEDGQKIIKTQWINITGKNTTYSFKANHTMAPYIYVHAMYLQPHQNKNNDMPLRMYGVIPVKIESKNSHLTPVIIMNNELRPNKPYTVKIREQKKLPMTYTLAIVDEGLLDITHYKTPNIWNQFNQKPALEVKTWDVFDKVIKHERFNSKNLLSIGGDGYDEETPPEGVKLNRFKPVVKFIGPFYCAPGQTMAHQLNMNNYVGSVRVMAIAGHNRAYGKASKTVTVNNPLMVLGTLPRILGPNEEITLPIDVFAMKDNIKNVSIQVQGNDVIHVIGNKTTKLKFNEKGEKQVYFKLQTRGNFGLAKVKITAKSGIETSTYEVELNVRAPNAARKQSYSEILPANTKFNKSFTAFGYKGTNNITVELSSIPSINLKKRLGYLMHYPYGCVEQTTSSVFPQLYLTSLMNLNNNQKRKIETNIKAGIKRLKRFQTYEGGLSYWPGGYESHEWGSNYAGHFLLEAKNKGFYVDDNILNKWITYQTDKANQWDNNDRLTQAYRLYLLAKAGKQNLGAMNRLRLQKYNDLSNWYLAGAYSIIGQTSIAEELIKPAPKSILLPTTNYNTFRSNTRDNAIILQLQSEIGNKNEALKMAKSIAEELNKNQYMSTQTTAYCLLGISQYVKTNSTGVNLRFNIKGQATTSKKSIWQQTNTTEGTTPIAIENTSESPLFLNVIQEGIPNETDTVNEQLGLKMKVEYLNQQGQKINPSVLKQGYDFVAQVTITNPTKKYYQHMSLSQIFPSGWEIHNSRMDNGSTWRNKANYEDIRDDRVDLFYNLSQNETKTFKVFLNASYIGKYYLPAVQTEAMYNNEIRARKHGYWIEVEK